MNELWTDGACWYRVRVGEPLPPGLHPIVSLAGEARQTTPEALAPLRLTEDQARRLLLARFPELGATGSLLQAFREVLAAGWPQGPGAAELLHERLERAAERIAGPGAEVARSALRSFPARLARAQASAPAQVSAPEATGELAEATALLSRFAGLARPEAVALAESLLRPDPLDLEQVFEPELCEPAGRYYEELWDSGPAPVPEPGQTQLVVRVASVQQLRDGTAEDFPGGYRAVAGSLVEGPLWFRWRWTRPGEPHGMAYDGLVHLPGGFWAWLPKPWRVLQT
jgi:hypothetical protein